MGLLDNLLLGSGADFSGQQGGLLDFLRNAQAQNQQYQPSAGFPAPPTQTQGRQFDPAMFDPNTYAPNQAQPIGVGGYQMPRMGSADLYNPQQVNTPPGAQPTQGQLPPTDVSAQSRPPEPQQQLPPALGGASNFLSRIGSPDSLLSRIAGNDTRSVQQQNLKAQYDATRQALIDNGETPQRANSMAMLAVMNPEAGKTVLNEGLTNKTELKMVKDALGQEHPFSWNSRTQELTPLEKGAGGTGSNGVSLLAPGVQQYNPNLSGNEYLNQFGPEVQAAVKAYIHGDVMPTGNPRTQAISTKAKEIAQKYGQDMGIPVSDALYSEKRKYQTELGSNSPTTAGGQAKAFNQGIFHMTELADKLEKLDNSSGLGIPKIAEWTNAARQGFSTKQSAISDEAQGIGQTLAGEVGKLFSGQAGGGVHERELTRDRFSTVKSPEQLAAALRATLITMDGGLKALEQRRDAVLGPNNGVDLVGEQTKQNLVKVQAAIDRLEGKAPAASTAPALPSGWSVKVR